MEVKNINRGEDLEKIVIGDVVEVGLGDLKKRLMVYNGNINGKDLFLERDREDSNSILCWSSEKEYFGFDNGIILPRSYTSLLRYNSSARDYKEKNLVLEKAGFKNG